MQRGSLSAHLVQSPQPGCWGKNGTMRPRVNRVNVVLLVAAVALGGQSELSFVLAHAPAMEDEGGANTHDGLHSSTAGPTVEFEIVIREDGYHVLKAGREQGLSISLVAGGTTQLTLRNEGRVPHEVISPLFTRTPVRFAGAATAVFRKEAAGFRLKPADSAVLEFVAPYSDFRTMYDLMWCSHDGGQKPEHKELLIVMTKEG